MNSILTTALCIILTTSMHAAEQSPTHSANAKSLRRPASAFGVLVSAGAGALSARLLGKESAQYRHAHPTLQHDAPLQEAHHTPTDEESDDEELMTLTSDDVDPDPITARLRQRNTLGLQWTPTSPAGDPEAKTN